MTDRVGTSPSAGPGGETTGDQRELSLWEQQVLKEPGHSQWYIERFRTLEREGNDIVGEARLIDAMVPRGSRVLDAGCGPGRLGGYLHQAGHRVTGVDVDPELIEAAEHDYPGPRWLVADLSRLQLAADPEAQDGQAAGEGDAGTAQFDVIVCAGNVVTFVAPSTRQAVLERLGAHLAPDGRLVVGFGAGRDYPFSDFFRHVDGAGLRVEHRFSTWDLRPFTDDSDFLVAVLVHD